MLRYTSEWDGSPQVLFRQRGECHSMPWCFDACANAFVCMNLLFTLRSQYVCKREMFIWRVCVWELVWVPIQMNNSVCWPSMFLLTFSNEETGDSTKSQAGPLISQTLAFTGSFICVYIKGQEHTLHLSLVTALQACCTWCAFLSLMQRCTKLSLAFVYFNAVFGLN